MNLDKTLKRRELKKEADKNKKVCKNCKHYRKRSHVTGKCYMHDIHLGWIRSEMANCFSFKFKEKTGNSITKNTIFVLLTKLK